MWGLGVHPPPPHTLISASHSRAIIRIKLKVSAGAVGGQLHLAEISKPQNCFICVGVAAFVAVCNGPVSGFSNPVSGCVATANCCEFRVLILI